MRCRTVTLIGLLLLTAPLNLEAAPFTQGNIVISRVGGVDDDLLTFPDSASRVRLLEINPADGSVVQEIRLPALPSEVVGSNNHLLTLNSDFRAGLLHRSVNGLYLVMGGYDAAAKDGSIAAVAQVNRTTSVAHPRVVARIDYTGAVDTTTACTNSNGETGLYSGDGTTGANASFRAVASLDGTSFWLAGRARSTGASREGRVQWVPYQGTQPNRIPNNSVFDDARTVNVFNNQLLGTWNIESVSNNRHRGVYAMTSNGGANTLPTAINADVANFPQVYDIDGFNRVGSPYEFYFTDPDTVYLCNDDVAASNGGLQKYVRDTDSMSPTFNQFLFKYTMQLISPAAPPLPDPDPFPYRSPAVRAVIGAPDGNGHNVLYVISAWSLMSGGERGNVLMKITDTGCPTGTEPGCTAADTFTILATAGDLEGFRGISFPPRPCEGAECIGACCHAGHACTEETPTACAASGGVFRGIQTTCATTVCGLVCHVPFADSDGDTDVDMEDFGQFQRCFTGPGGVLVGDCKCFDRPEEGFPNGDNDVDQSDLNAFINCATRSGVAANPACGG